MPKLVVFLSYATEDQQLATTIANKLSGAFGRALDLRYMSKFELGVNFRTTIDQALDAADILLVIATGREKLSHTFTGYEVGYFRRSQQTRPYIDETKKIERLIIPVAIFADTPVTISEIEGIGIGQADRFFFELVDGKLTGQKDDPLFSLLGRIDSILEKTEPDARSIEQRRQDYDRYKEASRDFYAEISELMSTLPLDQATPKTKIIVRLPSNYVPPDVGIDNHITFAQSGPTTGIFSRTPPLGFQEWKEIATCIGPEEVALTWRDALTNLISAAVTGDFSQQDEIVFSYDRQKAFRLFISKNVLYFDRSQTLDIYVIPILKHDDVGDPKTTFLSKGLEAGLRYRALFLEPTSPFAPIMFRFGEPSEFRKMVSNLLRELRLLLVRSDEAKLSERDNLVWLFGPKDESVKEVLGMMELWNAQKELLYDAAEKALAGNTPDKEQRESFVRQLREFCEKTSSINTAWLKKVMDTLTGVLLAEQPRLEHGTNVKILDASVRRAAGAAVPQE
jgi:TIR domain